MRYRPIEIRDERRGDGGTISAIGTLLCLDANPAPTGPNRVPVARFTGRVACVGDRWQPIIGEFGPVEPADLAGC